MPMVPTWIINHQTTGAQPKGYSCLHFCCDGSDKDLARKGIVKQLFDLEADLELKDAKENTPYLLAAGCGVSDVAEILAELGADVCAKNYLGKSAEQKSRECSTTTNCRVKEAGAPRTDVEASGQTRTGFSKQRRARYTMAGAESLHRRHRLRTNLHTGSQHCIQGPGTWRHR